MPLTYAALVATAAQAVTEGGWTRSDTHMMDETGAIDLVGAFAIALGIELQPGRNEPVYDRVNDWFDQRPDFKAAVLSPCSSTSLQITPWLVDQSNNHIETQEDALMYFDWLLDVLEVRQLKDVLTEGA